MKTYTQFILEAEQSKRMLNPISWYKFIKLAKENKIIPGGTDKLNAGDYITADLVKELESSVIPLYNDRFIDNDTTQWYVICGNYKTSWTGFNVEQVFKSLGKPNNEKNSKDDWHLWEFDKCIFYKIPTKEAGNHHWVMICDPTLLDDMNIDIVR